MKQNKNIQPPINPDEPAYDLEYVPTWQATPFTIRGVSQVEAADIQAAEEAKYNETVQHTTQARKPAAAAPEQPSVVYTEPSKTDRIKQYFADAHVRRFDKAHGSNLYGELLAQRRRDALFLKASQIGLLGRDSDYYRAKLKKLAKTAIS